MATLQPNGAVYMPWQNDPKCRVTWNHALSLEHQSVSALSSFILNICVISVM